MINIPIYRANKKNSNDIVIGFLIKKNYDNQKVRYFILEDKNIEVAMTYEIDETTLAIHFENMLDSEGNKIFASLSKDGIGGSLLDDGSAYIYTGASYLAINAITGYFIFHCPDNRKVIGIQK